MSPLAQASQKALAIGEIFLVHVVLGAGAPLAHLIGTPAREKVAKLSTVRAAISFLSLPLLSLLLQFRAHMSLQACGIPASLPRAAPAWLGRSSQTISLKVSPRHANKSHHPTSIAFFSFFFISPRDRVTGVYEWYECFRPYPTWSHRLACRPDG